MHVSELRIPITNVEQRISIETQLDPILAQVMKPAPKRATRKRKPRTPTPHELELAENLPKGVSYDANKQRLILCVQLN